MSAVPTPLEISWDSLDRLLGEGLEDMLAQHWEEVALDRDLIPLDPDWETMRRMERAGDFRVVSARRNGRLVGYAAFLVSRPLHYRTTLHALNDVIYIAPEERRGLTGVRLICWSESALAKLGVVKVIYHTKLHVLLGAKKQATLSDLLERLGYRHGENMLSKVLR